MKKRIVINERQLAGIIKDVIENVAVSHCKGLSPLILEKKNWILSKNSWDVNDYERFIDIVNMTPRDKKGFLSYHGIDEISQKDWRTYTLRGHNVAFALHYLGNGQVDICNLVNNDNELHGIGDDILTFAKMQGGTQMDNFRGENGENGFLGDKYRRNGFDRQTWMDRYNPEFQSDDPEWRFDTEKWGTPDVEGLERSKHRREYNNKFHKRHHQFDKKIKDEWGIKECIRRYFAKYL